MTEQMFLHMATSLVCVLDENMVRALLEGENYDEDEIDEFINLCEEGVR